MGVNKTVTHRVVTFGDRAADFAAKHIGSWAFLIVFNFLMFIWIITNLEVGPKAFDPLPFIGLNLILSWLAGIQAPVIMISQNRQEALQKEMLQDMVAIGSATYELTSAIKQLLVDQSTVIKELDILEGDE